MKNLKVGLDQGLLKETEEAEQDRHIKEGEKKAPTLPNYFHSNDLTIKLAALRRPTQILSECLRN